MNTKFNLTLALVALTINLNAHAALPAPLPDLMNDAQAAKWTAEQASVAQTAAKASDSSTQFYTGKPLVTDAGGYIFKYRTYSPEMSRWTSADPSGFPDGANAQMYLKNPMSSVDPLGLYDLDEVLGGAAGLTGSAATGVAAFTVLAAAGPETAGTTIAAAGAAEFLSIQGMFLGGATLAAGIAENKTFIPQSFSGAMTLAITSAAGADTNTAQLCSTIASSLEEVFGPAPEIKAVSKIIRKFNSYAAKLDASASDLKADETLRTATQNGQPGFE